MKNVYLALPSYTGKPEAAMFHCLLQDVQAMQGQGFGVHIKFAIGNGQINHARDRFVADFLTTACTDFLMIDDDIQWEPGALLRLLSHEVEFCGGIYPKKETPIRFPVKRLEGEKVQPNGLLKVRMLPGGFLRMTRACLEAMTAHYPGLAYHDPDVPGGKNCALFLPALLPMENGDNELWGEDFMFCRRWTEMGGEIFADTLLRFKHIGRAAYEGCYYEALNGNRS